MHEASITHILSWHLSYSGMGEPYGEEARELGEVSSRLEDCELMRSSTSFHFMFQVFICISSKMAAHSTPLHYLFIYCMPSKWQSKWANRIRLLSLSQFLSQGWELFKNLGLVLC